MRARQVSITVDGGSLTVAGRIDASGFQPGIIRLAARGDLNLLGTLDAHGAGLRRDSHGQIIDSPNRAQVSLTSSLGTLTLGPSASIDLRAGTEAAGNDTARGTLDLNARRLGGAGTRGDGAGADDVAILVQGRPQVRARPHRGERVPRVCRRRIGERAGRVRQQAPADHAGHADPHRPRQPGFHQRGVGSNELRARLAGLDGYRLRPGVDIVSDPLINPAGNLTVVGDLDLSGLRYGPGSTATILRGAASANRAC